MAEDFPIPFLKELELKASLFKDLPKFPQCQVIGFRLKRFLNLTIQLIADRDRFLLLILLL